jgi:hypothetical protein
MMENNWQEIRKDSLWEDRRDGDFWSFNLYKTLKMLREKEV